MKRNICISSILLIFIFPLHTKAQVYMDSIMFQNGSIASIGEDYGNPPIVLPAVKYTAPYNRFSDKVISHESNRSDLLPCAYGVIDIVVDIGGTTTYIRNSTTNFTISQIGSGKTQIEFEDNSINVNDLNLIITPLSPPHATQMVLQPLAGLDQHKVNVQMYGSTGSTTATTYSFAFKAIRP